jgi:hypothetical protein
VHGDMGYSAFCRSGDGDLCVCQGLPPQMRMLLHRLSAVGAPTAATDCGAQTDRHHSQDRSEQGLRNRVG